jgi:hypothetical protein
MIIICNEVIIFRFGFLLDVWLNSYWDYYAAGFTLDLLFASFGINLIAVFSLTFMKGKGKVIIGLKTFELSCIHYLDIFRCPNMPSTSNQ